VVSASRVVDATLLRLFNPTLFRIKECKAIPLPAFTGPEGSRRLNLPDFKIIGTWRW
jgi:hypothetical protein